MLWKLRPRVIGETMLTYLWMLWQPVRTGGGRRLLKKSIPVNASERAGESNCTRNIEKETYPARGIGFANFGVSTVTHQLLAHRRCVALGNIVNA